MKPRRVMVTLELDTGLSMQTLKSRQWWAGLFMPYEPLVVQVQTNVVKQKPDKREVRKS